MAEGQTDGRPCVVVYVARIEGADPAVIPPSLEGWPVVSRESGEFRARDDQGDALP